MRDSFIGQRAVAWGEWLPVAGYGAATAVFCVWVRQHGGRPPRSRDTVSRWLRQQGRERAASVLDVAPDADAITAAIRRALSAEFRVTLEGMSHPYGEGRAAERIVSVLVPQDRKELLVTYDHLFPTGT